MININCANCPNHCCGMNPSLTPVLTESEENLFKDNSKLVRTSNRDMYLLLKKINGNCIFLDDKTGRCEIYESRPLECRLFPFLLDFEHGYTPNIRLDSKNCPNILTLTASQENILNFLREYKFDKKWIEGYKSLSGV